MPFGANVNGGEYSMPSGEWIKFDWYVKVSPDTAAGRQGILRGWINNVLRFDYHNIATIQAGSYKMINNILEPSNVTVLGEKQERFWDLFRIGPGTMVLSERGWLDTK